jgi:hypothetical protein
MNPSATDGFVFAAGRRERLGDARFASFLRLGSEIARLSDVHAHAFDTDQRPSRSLSVRRYPGGDLLLVSIHFLLDVQDYGNQRRLVGIVDSACRAPPTCGPSRPSARCAVRVGFFSAIPPPTPAAAKKTREKAAAAATDE